MKERIKKWYKLGLWTEEMVLKAVEKNVITQKDMEEIINQ